MDSLEAAEEVNHYFDDEINCQEALEFIADWSVMPSPRSILWYLTESVFDYQTLELWKMPRPSEVETS